MEKKLDTLLRLLESDHTLYLIYRLHRYKKWLRSPQRAADQAYRAELQQKIRERRDQQTHARITRDFLKRNGKQNVRSN